MIKISHRGNINNIDHTRENSPSYIDEAIRMGYDVEIDIRFINDQLYLGHDIPEYKIDINFLTKRKDNLWVHTKDFKSLSRLISLPLRIFFHEKEAHTIIHNTNLIWSHNLNESNENSIIPLLTRQSISESSKYMHVYGICSDFVGLI